MQNIYLQGHTCASQERVFNLFLFIDKGIISTYGAYFHKISGTEDQKCEYLKAHVQIDLPKARRFRVPKHYSLLDPTNGAKWEGAISADGFYQLAAVHHQLPLFEEAFISMRAPRGPLFCITAVADGIPVISGQKAHVKAHAG